MRRLLVRLTVPPAILFFVAISPLLFGWALVKEPRNALSRMRAYYRDVFLGWKR
jgi:hypothetical protein